LQLQIKDICSIFLIKSNELNFSLPPPLIFDQFFNFNFDPLQQLHEGLIIYDFFMLSIEYILGCKQDTMNQQPYI